MRQLCSLLCVVGLFGGGAWAEMQAPPLPPYPYEDYHYPVPQPQQTDDSEQRIEPMTEEWEAKEDIHLGQVTGVGVDSEGNIHVFHRGSRVWDESSFNEQNIFQHQDKPIPEATHFQIDPNSGNIVDRGCENRFFLPHGLTVDSEDNIWLTDVALHQVFKMKKGEHEPSLVLGKKFQPGSDSAHFCKPTDVAVASTGEFFVSDGYCNSRIMKFDSDGTFITSFGRPDEAHGPPFPAGDFAIPHSVALIEDWNLLCVADRENQRVQCFSAGLKGTERPLPVGTFIKKAENLGRVFAIRSSGHFLVGVTNNQMDGDKEDKNQMFIVNLENGDSFTFEPNLNNPHALAIASEDTMYVGEIGPDRVVKVTI